MDHAEKEKILDVIQANYVKCNGLILKHPSANVRSESTYIYEDSYEKAERMGLMSFDDTIIQMIKLGMWSLEEERAISGLKDDIHKIRKGLIDLVFQKDKLEKMRQLLRNAEKVLIEKIIKKNGLAKGSLESYCSKIQQKFIISQITFVNRKQRKWDQEEFDNECDIGLIDDLCSFYFNISRFRQNIIRELARTEPWRSFWRMGKNLNVFGNKPCNWSYNQMDLAKWSDLYDSIYSAYERPSEMIINDDDLLDSWLIKQSDEVNNKLKGNQVKDLTNNKPIKGKREVFIMTDSSSAKEIYDINNTAGKIAIKAKQKILDEKGELLDQNAPDSQQQIRQMAAQNNHKKKSISQR